MGEKESLCAALTALGHYFSMAHDIGLNAQLCLDKVRNRFWRRLGSLTFVIFTLISFVMIFPYSGDRMVVIPFIATIVFAFCTIVYVHTSLNEYLRPSDAERVVAKKWKKFLKIAYRLELVHTLADSIRSETDNSTQLLIQSGNQFGSPYFREEIRRILREMASKHAQGVTDAERDTAP